MKKFKPTIRKKVFLSHIIVVVISLFLIFITFNFCINLYIKKSTQTQLIDTAKTIEKSMNEYADKLDDKSKLENSNDIIKYPLKINKLLKEDKSFFHIYYGIINQDKKLMYPKRNDIENYDFVRDKLISAIDEKRLIKQKNTQNSEYYFDVLEERYVAVIYKLNITDSSNDGYLIVYSDIVKTQEFIKIANIILLIILVIASVISIIISNNIAEKISKPILDLSVYAKKICEGQYNAELITHDNDDEIGRLAKIMKLMGKRLFTYDNKMKTFIQNASHEIRTPLMSIQGYAEGIKYKVVDDNDKAVNIIIDESKRLATLVDDLLYLSKIEATDEMFNIEELNIEHIILRSIEKVNGIAVKNEKRIKFICDEPNITIIGDEEKLIRAIINILGNSLRYCIKNIDVILKKEDAKIIIIIEDDGIGIDEIIIENIFDRFFKGKKGNYGLGLAITKSIIEKHHGTIMAENKDNGGARFKITF